MTPSPVIHRYEIPVDDQVHQITIGLGLIHVAARKRDVVEVWAYAPTGNSAMTRSFLVVGTGQPCPVGTWHAGTAITPDGQLVWHLLETVTPPVEARETPG